jgi:phosphatidate cytidylyltransferase
MIPAVLAVVWFAPVWLFTICAAALAAGTLREYLDLAGKASLTPLGLPAYVMVVLLVASPRLGVPVEPAIVVVVLALGFLGRDLVTVPAGSAATVFGIFYIGLPLMVAAKLREEKHGHLLILYVLVMIWVSDTAAYYGGRFLGRGGKHKLAPRVSPGKTWEGAVTSVVFAAIAGYFYMKYAFPAITTIESVFLAITVNIAGQLGDLAESALKRGAGVKDSGTILPGHGGLLDRIDALLFAFPALWYDMKVIAFFHRLTA